MLKAHGGVGGDYRQHEREVERVTMGDLIESCVREGGAKAGEEAQVSGCYKPKGEVHSDARREVGGVQSSSEAVVKAMASVREETPGPCEGTLL